MNERPCIRCEHLLSLEEGHLVYCSHCGAPQIFLSEQTQAEIAETARAQEAEQERGAVEPRANAGPPWMAGPVSPWRMGLRYALLGGAVTLGLGFASLAVPPVSLLLMMWVISAPVLTVGLYKGRSGATLPMGPGFPARLGLVTGLLVGFASAVVFTANLLVSRFVLHDAAALDQQMTAAFVQQRQAVVQRLGTEALPILDKFAQPEFRVGLLLCVFFVSGLVYLGLSTLAGGFAGLLLRSRRGVDA